MPRTELKTIAVYQKGILVCILVYFILVVAQFAVPSEYRGLIALPILGVLGLTSTVFVFLLSTKVYGTGTGVLLALLTLIPCLGLISLLMINSKATSVLQLNGIAVGLLGADTSKI